MGFFQLQLSASILIIFLSNNSIGLGSMLLNGFQGSVQVSSNSSGHLYSTSKPKLESK
ncbi:unnamed protein product [Meloidogyne enterolobii]|uniref:Uncharacterized protein n=1 Tax=Meloidogyne enterolobii TaxID=390850 RepID=A0ACB0XLT2_MELEN